MTLRKQQKAVRLRLTQALNQSAVLEEVNSFLADTDLEITFPEKMLHSLSDFAVWYAGGEYSDGDKTLGMINIFLDVVYKVRMCIEKIKLPERVC